MFDVDLGDVLGRETFGTVYKAKRLHDNLVVAARQLIFIGDSDISLDDTEIENIELLPQHANLVNVLDHGPYNGEYWIFMELCDLGDLYGYVQKNTLDMTFKLHVMLDCAMGLSFLHENDIVHRDINPHNILLQSVKGQPIPIAKIGDFGVAKFFSRGM